MSGKKIGSASLAGEETDPFAGARKINGASRDAVPAVPIGDIGFGAPNMEGKYSEGDIPMPDPSDSGQHFSDRKGLGGTEMASAKSATQTAKPRQAARQMTHEELMAKAQSILDAQKVQQDALLGAGPAVGVRDDAGGKMPDWLVQAGGSDEQRAQAYRPESGRADEIRAQMRQMSDKQKNDFALQKMHEPRGRSRRGIEDDEGSYDGDIQSLGPSGEHNNDPPDYNFIKTPSPLNVAAALDADKGAITVGTEDYMRRNGMWGQNTDDLLKREKLR